MATGPLQINYIASPAGYNASRTEVALSFPIHGEHTKIGTRPSGVHRQMYCKDVDATDIALLYRVSMLPRTVCLPSSLIMKESHRGLTSSCLPNPTIA